MTQLGERAISEYTIGPPFMQSPYGGSLQAASGVGQSWLEMGYNEAHQMLRCRTDGMPCPELACLKEKGESK
jgi:hypothetical protein